MITVTEQAGLKIKEMIENEEDQNTFVRLGVKGGGCSGLSYGLGFDPQKNDDDLHNGDHYLFTSGGRIISKENITRLDCRSVQQAHRYVLLHSDEMNAFRE